MNVKYSPQFLKTLKKLNVRIRNNFLEKITIFIKNPKDIGLNNHFLKRDYEGYRSIDVTTDWRAIYYEEVEKRILSPILYQLASTTNFKLERTSVNYWRIFEGLKMQDPDTKFPLF